MTAGPEHIAVLAAELPLFDNMTMAALGIDARHGYGIILARSLHAYAALEDGTPVAVWGACSDDFLDTREAHVWLLASRRAAARPYALASGAARFIRMALHRYGRLTTTVLTGLASDQRFIEWLGFTRDPKADFPGLGGVFLAYERRR